MAETSQFWQCHDPANGSQPGGENRCRIIIPVQHRIVTARVWFQNMVATGTLTVTLRSSDSKDDRSGRPIAVSLDNDDLNPGTITLASKNNAFDFVVDAEYQAWSPAYRHYWITLTGTNSADRLDWPTLGLWTMVRA